MTKLELMERLMVADGELVKAQGVFIELEDITPEIQRMRHLIENARREIIAVLKAQ